MQPLLSWLPPRQAAIVVAANGDYSFRGSGFVRGGIFDRLQLVQNDATILFKDKDYRKLDRFGAQGAPEFQEIALFRVPETANFDPAQPFRLELLAQRPIGPIKKAFTSFSLPYELPARFLSTQEAPTQIAAPTGPASAGDTVRLGRSGSRSGSPTRSTWRCWRSRWSS